jgi:hypothetical protein
MGGYAGDSYRIASDRERAILSNICLAFVLALFAFLGFCLWGKFF